MDRPVFSEMLAIRRRELGYSIRQASRILRLREDVLVAFEEGDFEHMPKSGYAQGMISSYARYLGLDPNEVTEAYLNDYEHYKREMKRAEKLGRSGSGRGSRSAYGRSGGQPYMGSRGLLPSSGGLAGDMGSFATTRVRTRPESRADDYERGADDLDSTQERLYTGRIPSRARRSYQSGAGSRGDIETMDVSSYDDDLRIGREAQPFESASAQARRRASREQNRVTRPRVNRRSGSTGGGRSSRNRSAGRGGSNSMLDVLLGGGSQRLVALVVVAVILIITVIVVVSVGSCVNPNTQSAKTVPVSEVSATDDTKKDSSTSSSASKDEEAQATHATTDDSSSSKQETQDSSTSEETSVSVSVADGAVTWLEVECDGKSDVAETVTGPWQKTYTVEDSLTVQAGDTTAVSVVQNGRQLQFESMASGIGSIRVQGTKKTTSSDKKNSESADASGSSTSSATGSSSSSGNSSSSDNTSAKTGNASNTTQGKDGQAASSAQNGTDGASAEGGTYGYDDYSYSEYGYAGEYY